MSIDLDQFGKDLDFLLLSVGQKKWAIRFTTS